VRDVPPGVLEGDLHDSRINGSLLWADNNEPITVPDFVLITPGASAKPRSNQVELLALR
jgi:hypothetical protein